MQGVTVVDHPLVQHKLTLMRDKKRSTKGFRQLLNEIGMLLCYEVTRDLPLELTEIETQLLVSQRLEFIAAPSANALLDHCGELGRMLSTLRRRVRASRAPRHAPGPSP